MGADHADETDRERLDGGAGGLSRRPAETERKAETRSPVPRGVALLHRQQSRLARLARGVRQLEFGLKRSQSRNGTENLHKLATMHI